MAQMPVAVRWTAERYLGGVSVVDRRHVAQNHLEAFHEVFDRLVP